MRRGKHRLMKAAVIAGLGVIIVRGLMRQENHGVAGIGTEFKKATKKVKKFIQKTGPGHVLLEKTLGTKHYNEIIRKPLKKYGVPVAAVAVGTAATILTAGAAAPVAGTLITAALTTGASIAANEIRQQQAREAAEQAADAQREAQEHQDLMEALANAGAVKAEEPSWLERIDADVRSFFG